MQGLAAAFSAVRQRLSQQLSGASVFGELCLQEMARVTQLGEQFDESGCERLVAALLPGHRRGAEPVEEGCDEVEDE